LEKTNFLIINSKIYKKSFGKGIFVRQFGANYLGGGKR